MWFLLILCGFTIFMNGMQQDKQERNYCLELVSLNESYVAHQSHPKEISDEMMIKAHIKWLIMMYSYEKGEIQTLHALFKKNPHFHHTFKRDFDYFFKEFLSSYKESLSSHDVKHDILDHPKKGVAEDQKRCLIV